MALNPKQLYSLPDTLVEMYAQVENDILCDMARRISTYDYFIPAALHQHQKLQELGMVEKDIIDKLASKTGQSNEKIVKLLTQSTGEAIDDDVEYYTRAEVYKPSKVDTEALYKQLNSGLLQTQQSFFNITRTTANTASKQFERALDRAWTQINVGGMDYTTAIKRAIIDLCEAGIGSVEYKNGRIDNIEVAVRRAVVTGANQTAMKTQEVLADELGVELVEVTAHGGARPEHSVWQGQVFSRNGRVTIDGVTYEDLRKATGYGRADGLGGINCRHNFHPYVPGTSRAYSDKDLAELDKKKVEYNGKMYTEYVASQIQRRIERDIRKNKRTISALEAAGEDAGEYRAKLRDSQKEYTDFTNQTGIRKQSARTQVAKVDTPKNIQTDNEKSLINTVKNIDTSVTKSLKPHIHNSTTSPKTNQNSQNTQKTVEKSKNSDIIEIDSDRVYEQASTGGRDAGTYREAMKKNKNQLNKSIRNHQKQVDEHLDKIKNPSKYDEKWNEKTQQQREGLIRKWKKDLQRNAEQAEIERRVRRDRFGE